MRITRGEISQTPLTVLLELLPVDTVILKGVVGFHVKNESPDHYRNFEMKQEIDESFHDFIVRVVYERGLINSR